MLEEPYVESAAHVVTRRLVGLCPDQVFPYCMIMPQLDPYPP